MKKIVAIFCLFIYSFTTVDATINAHYCMGEYAGSSLYHTSTDKCAICGMEKTSSKGCCKDKVKVVQLKVEHNQLKDYVASPKFETDLLFYADFNKLELVICGNKLFHFIYPPPLIHKQRLHLLNCVFLI